MPVAEQLFAIVHKDSRSLPWSGSRVTGGVYNQAGICEAAKAFGVHFRKDAYPGEIAKRLAACGCLLMQVVPEDSPWASDSRTVDRKRWLESWEYGRLYRLPTREDIVPGQEMFQVEVESVPGPTPGTKIHLDDPCTNGKNVYFHCEGWDGGCFVPVTAFLGRFADRHDHRYIYLIRK